MINIQNIDDNECFKWNIVRYLNPTDRHPERITKTNKEFAKKLDFKNIEFPVKIRDIGKIENKNSIGISAFAYDKEKHQIYVHVLLIREEGYVLINNLNTSCMIILSIAQENIFAVIVYKLLVQKKY